MLTKLHIMKKYFTLLLLSLMGSTIVCAQEADSAAVLSTKFYVRGCFTNTINPSIYKNYYQYGYGGGVGVSLILLNNLQLQLNADLINLRFDIEKFANTNSAYKTTDLESFDPLYFSLSPELKYMPNISALVKPYVNIGLKVLCGAQDGTISKIDKQNNTTLILRNAIGYRFVPLIGLGSEIVISRQVNVFIEGSYQFEILENNKPVDPFFQFAKPENLNLNFIQINMGLAFKFYKSKE